MKGTTLKRFGALVLTALLAGTCISCDFLKKNEDDELLKHADDEKYITCMVWDRDNLPEGKTFNDNTLAEWIRDEVRKDCGIDVHFVSVPRENSDKDIQRMIEEGTAPDIIFTYSASMFGYLTKQSKVADLTDAIKKYGGNISKYIDDIQYMGQYNDRQVAVMGKRDYKMPRHVAFIRSDWCKALGMEIPQTKEQLIDYLYAVKEKNPGGVKNVEPWAMGGFIHSERFFLNFVTSYVDEISERDAFIYSEKYMTLVDGAEDGLLAMNKLYNDGIITLDFTADTDNSEFYKTISEGRAGFFVDDNTASFSSIEELMKNDPEAEVEPVLCFELSDGSYRNICEPSFGLYMMVPNTSKGKIDSVVKYLNWLADPENAIKVYYTPDYKTTSDGAPVTMSNSELMALGYTGNPSDYCIVNKHFDFMDDRELTASSWSEEWAFEDKEWFENFYDICNTGQYEFPASSVVLEADAKYSVSLDEEIVEYAYNLICCPTHEFDMQLHDEYDEMVQRGLSEVLDERAAYYDSGKLRIGK